MLVEDVYVSPKYRRLKIACVCGGFNQKKKCVLVCKCITGAVWDLRGTGEGYCSEEVIHVAQCL